MISRLRLFALMMVCHTLTGCDVTADYQPPAPDLPSLYSEADEPSLSASSEASLWWMSFADAELNSLVTRALHANSDLTLADARIKEARARLGTADAALYPTVSAAGRIGRERESENAPNPLLVHRDGSIEAPGTPENIFQAGFDATWELDLFGGAKRAIEAAQADTESAAYDRGAVALSLIAELARDYIQLRELQQLGRLAVDKLATQQDLLGLVRVRYAAGMATELDVFRADMQVQRATLQQPATEAASKMAIYHLSVLLGLPPAALMEELRPDGPIPVSSAMPPMGLPSEILRQRPDIRAAERRLAASAARLGVAQADLYPKFSLFGSVGLSSVAAGDFFNSASTLWSIGPMISWPVFQEGRLKAVIEVRDAQQQQELIIYRRAILNGIEDVEAAAALYRRETDQRKILEASLEIERHTVELVRARYGGGLVDFRDVLDAQRDFALTQSELVHNDAARSLGLISLYKALGGGWQASLTTADPGGAK